MPAPDPVDLRNFQRTHANHLGRPLLVDGVLGTQTRWAMALEEADPRRRTVVRRAISQIGCAETPPGSNRSASIDAWLKACGVTPGNPWCAAFASWCLKGLTPPCAGAVVLGSRFPDGHASPQPGDVMWYRTDDQGHGHIGIVIGVSWDEVMTVEGNVDSRVGVWRRPLEAVHIGRTLDTPPLEPAPGVILSVPLRAVNGVGTR